MHKKEVLELRKQYKPEECSITRICGCYVDGNKEIIAQSKDAFLSLPDEEIFKYLTIFKQTLSGTIGKNLINMEFPLEQEMPGGTQEFLLQLRDSKLQDDMLIEEFYQKIIDNYIYGENYYIMLIHLQVQFVHRKHRNKEVWQPIVIQTKQGSKLWQHHLQRKRFQQQ